MAKDSKSKKTVDAVYEEETPKSNKKVVEKKEEVVVESPIKSGMSETTKGMIVGILVTALIATIIILLILGKNEGNNRNFNSSGKVDPSTYSEAMEDFYKYFESDELALIVFASSNCSYCLAEEPIVKNIAETYGIKYLYMDYLDLGNDAEVSQVISELGITGSTPTSVVVKNGEIIKSWVGYVDGPNYVKNLIDAGMLEKGSIYAQASNIESIDYSKFKSLVKDSKVSAVIFDAPNCTTTCNNERTFLNSIAKENNLTIYHLSASAFSETDQNEFVDELGNLGYDTDEYKDKQEVNIPLLMFVKNGKIVEYYVGYESEDEIASLFKKVGLTK